MTEMTPTVPAAEPPGSRFRRRTRNVLIVFTILWGLALLPAAFFAMLFPFAFDQGASDAAWRVALGLIGMPFAFIIGLVLMWGLFLLKKYRAALIAISAPVIYLIIFALVA